MNRLNPNVDGLRNCLAEIARLLDVAAPKTVDHLGSPNFKFVTDLFLITEAEHLRAVRDLLNARHFVGANILGRVMFEGMILLLWMSKDREARAEKWCAWAHVLDWRTLQMKDREGLPVSHDQRERVERGIEYYGHLFLQNKAHKHDPYVLNWTPTIAKMATDINLYSVYDSAYRSESQWVHWTAGGVGRVLSKQGPVLSYDFENQSSEVSAINTSFHAAWHMLYNASRWFDIGVLSETLENLSGTFTQCYEQR